MGLLFRRRRPLLGAAMLAGAGTVAYRAGQRRQADEDASYPQEADAYNTRPYDQPRDRQDDEQYGRDSVSGTVAELERLKALLDQGVLTQEEFVAAKQRILAG